MNTPSSQTEIRFQGIPVSPGIVRGAAWLHRNEEEIPPQYAIAESQVESELARFREALTQTRQQLEVLQQRISVSAGAEDAAVFDAHVLLVEDQSLFEEVARNLRKELLNVEAVYSHVAGKYAKSLSEIDDPYLRERSVDILDVSRRVVRNLLGKQHGVSHPLSDAHVLVSHNLTPSDTAQLDKSMVMGIATDVGSKTSHTAIMARSLQIPAVVGLHAAGNAVVSGDRVLLDGYRGLLILNPSEETVAEYAEIERARAEVEKNLVRLKETECKTADGRHVVLSANIEMPGDAAAVLQCGAEGVGLFRTEFFYINRTDLPSEEEQYEAYASVARKLANAPLIIRTLDIGGDKTVSALNQPPELNPFLGWRAIRYCLEEVDVFKTQIRAILRASAHGNVRMMYPMISGVEEVRQANAVVEQCKQELRAARHAFNPEMEIGAMVEIPSAAVTADLIAHEVDFFSIGTNDLIQYTMAVDRMNERIAYLYQPTHPAILRLIRGVVGAARQAGIWAGVCGEMAGEPVLIPLLLGLGVEELSAGVGMVPRIKRAVQSLDLERCRIFAEEVLAMDCSQRIYERCESLARELYPDLL
jgi:phosphotransferase system enzyme I (PtsI)